MRLDHLHHHLDRRQLLKAGAAGAAAAAVTTSGLGGFAGTAGASSGRSSGAGALDANGYDDSFNIAGATDGSWAAATTARYGAADQRGTFNEVTAHKTARALQMLDTGNVKTVVMGHLLRNNFPAFRNFPPRKYEQRLHMFGYEPLDPSKWFSTTTPGLAGEDEWRTADRARGPLGYNQGPVGYGPNNVSTHEERFPEGGTYQIATQLDGLPHIGVGNMFYNGNDARYFAEPEGTNYLGIEQVGPIVTRGVLIDVLGWKQSRSSSDVINVDGMSMLSNTYRITVEDLQDAMAWEGCGGLEAGDVVVIRTGWHQLAERALDNGEDGTDPDDLYNMYLNTEPGIYLREAKFLGDHCPAIIASDSYALEVLGYTGDPAGWVFPVHQELIPKRGIAIGEGVISDGLANEGVHEFVYCYMPNYAKGATAGCTAPFALING